jgi:hypothetical protein
MVAIHGCYLTKTQKLVSLNSRYWDSQLSREKESQSSVILGSSGGVSRFFRLVAASIPVCGRNKKILSAVKEKFPDIETLRCNVGDARQRKELTMEVLISLPSGRCLAATSGQLGLFLKISFFKVRRRAECTNHPGNPVYHERH